MDIEGWRAVSRLRSFDLTPCCEEGIVLSTLLVVLLISSVVTLYFLGGLPKRERTRNSRWLLRAKLVNYLTHCVREEAFALNMTLDTTRPCLPVQLSELGICVHSARTCPRPAILHPRIACPGCVNSIDLCHTRAHSNIFARTTSILASLCRRNLHMAPYFTFSND